MKWILKNIEELISMIALTIMILLICINVIARFFFTIAWGWLQEVAIIAFAWCIFIGAAACYKRKMHVGIDFLINLFPASIKRIVVLFVNILLVISNIYLTYLSLVLSVTSWHKPTDMLRLPYTFVNISATIGFTFMTFHAINDLRKSICAKDRCSEVKIKSEGVS